MKRMIIALVLLAVASACSQGTDAATADRTVTITMRDNRFTPGAISVRRGETVEFRFVNKGRVTHDAFIGDEGAQQEHEAAMPESDDGHGGHGSTDSDAITVDAGDRGRLTHTFDEPGEILIGCHEPGHYDDGMVVEITVR